MAQNRKEKKKKKKSVLEAEIMAFIQKSIKTVAEQAVKDVVNTIRFK